MSTESFEECATAGLAEVCHKEGASHSSNGYCSYCYDQVEDWISSARSYVCDALHGMNSKATNRVLLQETLELLDLLKQAFKDSKEVLNSPTFRINVEKNHSVIRDILNACPDEKQLDAEDEQELAAAKARMAIDEAKLGEKSKYANILSIKAN